MKLSFTNFKTWKNKTFEFPEKGLIALSGSSGKGKSSIFEGISFALYGKPKKVVTFGETKCKVEFEVKTRSAGSGSVGASIDFKIGNENIKITRTKRPDHLKLTKDGNTYEDAVAQGIINKYFGEEFLLTSYMAQKTDTTFLRLSASEKALFLEKIAFNGVDITSLKKKVKGKIKEIKEKQNKKSGELTAIETEFKSMSEPEEVSFPIKGYRESEKEGIEKHNDMTEKCTKSLKDNSSEKVKLEYKIKELLSKQERIEELNQQSFQLNSELNKYQTEFSSLNYSDLEFSETKDKLQVAIKHKEYSELTERYKSELEIYKNISKTEAEEKEKELSKIQTEYNKIPESIDIEELKNKKTEKSKQLEVIKTYEINTKKLTEKRQKIKNIKVLDESELLKERDNIKNKIDDINSRINTKKCPHCKVSIRVYNNEVSTIENSPLSESERNSIPKLRLELKEKEKIILENSERKKEYTKLDGEIKELEIGDEPKEDKARIQKEINELEDKISEQIKLEYKRNELLNKKESLQFQIENGEQSKTLIGMKDKLKKMKEKLSKMKDEINSDNNEDSIESLNSKFRELSISKEKNSNLISNIKNVQNRIKKINDEISLLETQISEISNVESKLSEINEKIKKYEDKLKKLERIGEKLKLYLSYKEKIQKYNEWKDKVTKKEEELSEISKQSVTANTFYKLILKTESQAVEEILDNINYNVKYYLEKFFPDDSMEVEVKSFKETKKGVEKPEISISIFYKGNECELSSLSGGERDRLELAFMLALNGMYSGESKIILLDECISSLHQELSTEILECLKELNDKLILVVSHQIILGAFDNVIEFD